MSALRAPRHLHPGAWWAWATALAVTASRTTNPVLLLLVIVVCGYVAAARRPATPWSRSYVIFLRLGLLAVVIRVVLFALLGSGAGATGTVLVRLPTVPLPHWMSGVRLGGPVTVDGILGSAYDGLRLAVILVCVGTANALTSPRRLLKSLPSALYEVGVAIAVALAFAPQSVAAVARLRAARRLRGRPDHGLRSLRGLAVPVLEGALDRSVDVAAAMDARGFGRRGDQSVVTRRLVASVTVTGLLAVVSSTYALLVPGTSSLLGLPLLVAGAVVTGAGFVLGARRGGRSRYRPDAWSLAEWLVVACGVAAVVGAVVAPTGQLSPSTSPAQWPAVPPTALAGIAVALLAGWAAPPLPRSRRPRAAADLAAQPAGAHA